MNDNNYEFVKWITPVLRFKGLIYAFDCFILLEEPQEGDKEEAMVNIAESELLEFSKFDINRVLKHGERLVGSSGAEYDLPDEDLTGIL